MKKYLTAIFCALLAAVLVFAACAPQDPDTPTPDGGDGGDSGEVAVSGGYEGTDGGVAFKLPDLGKEVRLHTELQAAYLNEADPGCISRYADGVNATEELDFRELSHPAPVVFTWEAGGAAEGTEYLLSVGEGEKMQDVLHFTTTETQFEVYDLKLATVYYWNVTAGYAESGKACFTTEGQGPRNLYVDGVANVRDMGGWPTESGGRVKQGLFYRCGRLNENYTGKPTVTEEGIRTMLDVLHIRTEIDLRGGSGDPTEHGNIEASYLGTGVTYYHLGMNWNGHLVDLNRKKIRDVFTILAQEESYPLIFHCSIGTDRTGMIAFLVGALVGISEQDLYRDYLFSNFAYIEGSRDLNTIKNTYVADLKRAAGETLAEKARSYLTETVRVPVEQLDAVVRILGG